MGDHYRTLGLGRDASKTDIKNAYLRLAQRYHPDHHAEAAAAASGEAAARFRQVKEAYDVLSDERRRFDYDLTYRPSSSSSSSSGHGHGHGGNSSSSSSTSSSSGPWSSSWSSSKHGN
nr:chaperone protein dnaJ 72-like [Aegilops tauschii subsp. strangulata]